MRLTLDFAKELNTEFANFFSAMAYPGSQLYRDALGERLAVAGTKWSGYSQHSKDCLPLPTRHLSVAPRCWRSATRRSASTSAASATRRWWSERSGPGRAAKCSRCSASRWRATTRRRGHLPAGRRCAMNGACRGAPARCVLSALVSTYASERYLQGCLESLLGADAQGRTGWRVVVVDAGSPRGEGALVRAFQRAGSRELPITYLRTEVPRSSSSASLHRRATELARGTLRDDGERRRPPRVRSSLERMVAVLRPASRTFGLAYADTADHAPATTRPSRSSSRRRRRFAWPRLHAGGWR
jgi:hypothetical protein